MATQDLAQKEIKDNAWDLWREYSETKNSTIREQLILKHTWLVNCISGRLGVYFGNTIDYEDLVSFGVFGLIDAIDKFDFTKGVKFETYASLRIKGAIIDGIRKTDWIPRSTRKKNKEVRQLYGELENELGRSASDSEIANRLGVSIDDFIKLFNLDSTKSMLSLDELIAQNFDAEYEYLCNQDMPEGYAEFSELKRILDREISRLPERERIIVMLYYFKGFSLKEISEILKVTNPRISQLHAKAILRLRTALACRKAALVG